MLKFLKTTWPIWALLAFAALLYFARRPAATPPPPAPATGSSAPRPTSPKTENKKSKNALAPALAAALALPDPRERARTFGTAFLALLARDPAAALGTVRLLPPGNERTAALLATLDALSRTDPERALALARELATTRDERAIYNILFDRFAREDSAIAITRLTLVPPGEARENSLRALVDGWSATAGSTAALDWTLTLAAPDRAPALESALTNLLSTDPLRALELAQKNLTDPALSRVVLASLQSLVTTDVDAAARLTALLPPGELQLHAVANVARPYAAKDPAAALAWSDSFTGLARRAAFSNTALAWSERDPAAAAQWLATQPPIATSPDTLPNVFAAWLGTDAPAARAWLATAPLTPETKASLESRAR